MGTFVIFFILLALIMAIIPIIILLIFGKTLYVGDNVLKRKINPNEEYLQEIQKIEDTKTSRLLNKAVIIILPWHLYLGDNENIGKYISVLGYFILTCYLINILVNYKKAFSYLKTKSENTSTKKYLLAVVVFCAILFIIMLIGLYLINHYLL